MNESDAGANTSAPIDEQMRGLHAAAQQADNAAEVAECMAALRDTLSGGVGDTTPDAYAQAQAALEAWQSGGVSALESALNPHRRVAMAVGKIKDRTPAPLLSTPRYREDVEEAGAVLSVGEVMVLGGAGGIGKSVWGQRLCYGMASGAPDAVGMAFHPALTNRTVLYASGEDRPGAVQRNIKLMAGGDNATLPNAMHVIDMRNRPIFGPEPGESLNARPRKLDGWHDLWKAAESVAPKLIVIDPAMSVFIGEANAVGAVRLFLSAINAEAERLQAGVVLLVHSNKAGRGKGADAYAPDMVAGSAAWVDGVRGAMSMTWGAQQGWRKLAVLKANYGPSMIETQLKPVHVGGGESGRIIDFTGDIGWTDKRAPVDDDEDPDARM